MTNNTFKKSPLKLVFIPVLFMAATACQDRDRDLEEISTRYDSISEVLQEEKRENDSLQRLLENGTMVEQEVVFYGNDFAAIENPKEYITSALRERTDQIPLDPVLGGTMEFRRIRILTENWIFAEYDDGHVQGRSLYNYQLQPDDSLNFEVLISDHPEMNPTYQRPN